MAVGDGLVNIIPSSISYSGTSATLNANGGVEFTDITSLTLEDVFSASYLVYLVSGYITTNGVTDPNMNARFRTGGSDATTNYNRQYLAAQNTTVSAARSTSQTFFWLGTNAAAGPSHFTTWIYAPFEASATVCRLVNADHYQDSYFFDAASIHTTATSYESITVYPAANASSGRIHIYGLEQ